MLVHCPSCQATSTVVDEQHAEPRLAVNDSYFYYCGGCAQFIFKGPAKPAVVATHEMLLVTFTMNPQLMHDLCRQHYLKRMEAKLPRADRN